MVQEPEPLGVSKTEPSLASIEADFKAFDPFLLEEGSDRDFRRISSFVTKSGFYKHVKDYPPKQLVVLVEDLKSEHSLLREAIMEYFAHATSLLDSTEPLVLGHLNTSCPSAGYAFI